MAEEIQAFEENQIWTIEDLPAGKKPIRKWVYRVEYTSDGLIERYKAHLVIRVDHQVDGFDFYETSAQVAKMTSVWVFLFVAIAKGWELHQMDVNNAFLHDDLEEKVYMKMPQVCILARLIAYVDYANLFMDCGKHLGNCSKIV